MIRSGPLAFLKNLRDPSKKTVIRVPSEVRYLKKVSSGVLSGLGRRGVDEGRAFDIKLCVEEAVRNAVVHGNKSDPARQVRLSYWVDESVLNIEIEDEGDGFNHELVKDPTKEENLLRNSGRGVYLIKKLMDKVQYNTKGNNISMSKRIK